MIYARVKFVIECIKCHVDRDRFFFDDEKEEEGVCVYCTKKNKKTVKAMEHFYNDIYNIKKGQIYGKFRRAGTGVDCGCPFGHYCRPRPNDIQQGRGMCRACAGQDPEVVEKKFRKRIERLGGTVNGKYVNSQT